MPSAKPEIAARHRKLGPNSGLVSARNGLWSDRQRASTCRIDRVGGKSCSESPSIGGLIPVFAPIPIASRGKTIAEHHRAAWER
jgi:hypothetical protein